MTEINSKSSVNVSIKKNLLSLAFNGVIKPHEMDRIYTEVRFCIADLNPSYNVIADFSQCRFMYLRSLKTFKKIFQYMLSNDCGEIIRVIQKNRIISKQILNYTFAQPGYKPTYLTSREDAEKKIDSAAKRNGLRFQLHEKPVAVITGNNTREGFILNISTSGCAISSNTASLKPRDELEVHFTLKAHTSTRDFTLKARVVRVESYTFAVQFINIADTEITHLKACLIRETEDAHI